MFIGFPNHQFFAVIFYTKAHSKSAIKEEKTDEEKEKGLAAADPFPPETFLPVNLLRWEDDIIIDGEQVRSQVLKRLASGKLPEYGWVPTQQTRNYESFLAALKSNAFEQMFAKPGTVVPTRAMADLDFPKEPTMAHSIFPMDNYDLINTRWEDDIIWDS
ncbi:unnamed protein product, partial [Anisakis simplex]|uniref:Reductive dehalogenase subunit A n=1 Tax=Anisakis simplex TaxID=6269 RepID=A0A0M3J911_ANISI